MSRGRIIGGLLLGTAASCTDAPPQAPMFEAEDCVRVDVAVHQTDPKGRDRTYLSGVEDMVRLPGGAVLVSAHDRRAAEATGGAEGKGGVFVAIGNPAIVASDESEWLRSFGDGDAVAYAVGDAPVLQRHGAPTEREDRRPDTIPFPHGIDHRGDRTAVVARSYAAGTVGSVRLITATGNVEVPASDHDLCAANDVALTASGTVLVTLDRRRCPGWSWWERLGWPAGRLLAMKDGASVVLASGLAHPNGVLSLDDGTIVVAETRARRLRMWSPSAGGRSRTLPLPGAPDNLSVAPDGQIVVALHPNLLRLARHRFGERETAPSRIVTVDVESGAVTWLLDHDGSRFSAATIGLFDGVHLMAGSVTDDDILWCGPV